MKTYVYEYDIMVSAKIEHRVESFTDVNEFIARVKHFQNKFYISNEKCYIGDLKEIGVEKVLNPF